MKILVFGSKGFIGSHLRSRYPDAVTPSADIADAQAVASLLDEHHPDVVINAAGKTGRPNVDWCEDHKEETIRSNVLGPLVLLEECSKRNIYWVHLGSGCIYEGDKDGRGWTEEDPPNFFGSFYSRTKAWSDQILTEFPVLNLRLRMPFDASQEPRSLITKLVRYDRVLDVRNSLTYIPDFLDALHQLMQRNITGTFNVINPGAISPYRIMEFYKDIVDPSHTFERLTLDHLSDVTKAGRSNCILSTEKLQKEGIILPPVEDRIREVLSSIKKR